ncbi:matrixin family metalloprotease [Saccharothrix saharensis]|uniref:matrixin family metalloprotease n=1 Tax=Saccharothrix saharensis TaxID=571190 RepID=UPI0036BA17DE
MKKSRAVTALVGVAAMVAATVPAAAPASAAPLGCQFSTPNLKWKASISNTAAYLNPAQWSAKYWHDTPTPVILTQVTSGANIAIADGNFGNVTFDGATRSGVDQTQAPSCASTGYWATGVVTWWNRYFTDDYSGQKKLSVMVHELGHALGLGHESHSSCSSVNIMETGTYQRYDVCGKYAPQAADINYVNALY